MWLSKIRYVNMPPGPLGRPLSRFLGDVASRTGLATFICLFIYLFIYLFIHLATILRQALGWFMQSCRVTMSWYKQNVTRKHESHINDAWCYKDAVKIYRKVWGTHLRRKRQPPRFVLAHQTYQIGIHEATQPYSNYQCSTNLLLVRILQTLLQSIAHAASWNLQWKKRWSSVSISPQTQIR